MNFNQRTLYIMMHGAMAVLMGCATDQEPATTTAPAPCLDKLVSKPTIEQSPSILLTAKIGDRFLRADCVPGMQRCAGDGFDTFDDVEIGQCIVRSGEGSAKACECFPASKPDAQLMGARTSCDDKNEVTQDACWIEFAGVKPDLCVHGKKSLGVAFEDRVAAANIGDYLVETGSRCRAEASYCDGQTVGGYETFSYKGDWMYIIPVAGSKGVTCVPADATKLDKGYYAPTHKDCNEWNGYPTVKPRVCTESAYGEIACSKLGEDSSITKPDAIACVYTYWENRFDKVMGCSFSDNSPAASPCNENDFVEWQYMKGGENQGGNSGYRWCTFLKDTDVHTHLRFYQDGKILAGPSALSFSITQSDNSGRSGLQVLAPQCAWMDNYPNPKFFAPASADTMCDVPALGIDTKTWWGSIVRWR